MRPIIVNDLSGFLIDETIIKPRDLYMVPEPGPQPGDVDMALERKAHRAGLLQKSKGLFASFFQRQSPKVIDQCQGDF